MRRIPINPYNAVPIYDNNTEGSQQAFLYSPTHRLPPMQFYLDSAIGIASWKLVRESDGAEFAQLATDWNDEESVAAGKAWYTYFGGDLDNPVSPGVYRAVITLSDDGVLYSHRLCCTHLFDLRGQFDTTLETSILTETCTGGSYAFEFDLGATLTYTVELSGSIVQSGTGPFEITGPITGSAFSVERTITITGDIEDSNGGRVLSTKVYTFVISDTSDPCNNYTLTGEQAEVAWGEELAYLEWWSNNDDTSANILYQQQTGNIRYKQRLYGKYWAAQPEPFVEEDLLVNNAGKPILRSRTVADVLNFDMWPIPDNSLIALKAASAIDNKQIVNMGGASTAIDFIESETTQPGDSDQLILNLSLRVNSLYQANCQEDFDLN